jgi:hypothetical protein
MLINMLVKHSGQTCWPDMLVNLLVKHAGQSCWSNILAASDITVPGSGGATLHWLKLRSAAALAPSGLKF